MIKGWKDGFRPWTFTIVRLQSTHLGSLHYHCYWGRGMGFNKTDLAYIQYGTLLHDIGKLGIPEKIMKKPGKLTPYEYQIVKQHPIYAHEWLLSQKDYQPAKVIPLFHHERWDGGGYPYGLKGERNSDICQAGCRCGCVGCDYI